MKLAVRMNSRLELKKVQDLANSLTSAGEPWASKVLAATAQYDIKGMPLDSVYDALIAIAEEQRIMSNKQSYVSIKLIRKADVRFMKNDEVQKALPEQLKQLQDKMKSLYELSGKTGDPAKGPIYQKMYLGARRSYIDFVNKHRAELEQMGIKLEGAVAMRSSSNFTKVSYVAHVPGHKNGQGEAAPWVIKDHKTGKILSSHTSEEDAKAHLQQMHIHKHMGSYVNSEKVKV